MILDLTEHFLHFPAFVNVTFTVTLEQMWWQARWIVRKSIREEIPWLVKKELQRQAPKTQNRDSHSAFQSLTDEGWLWQAIKTYSTFNSKHMTTYQPSTAGLYTEMQTWTWWLWTESDSRPLEAPSDEQPHIHMHTGTWRDGHGDTHRHAHKHVNPC